MTILLIGEDLDQYVGNHYFHVKTEALLCHSFILFEMALKNNEYSTDLRSLVIEHFLNSDSYTTVAKKLPIPRSTISFCYQKIQKPKRVLNLSGRGRKRKSTASVDWTIQCKIKVDRRKSAATVKIEIEKELGVFVHADTVRSRLHEIGLNGRVARKKLDVNKINQRKRIAYAKTMMEKSFDYWKRFLWSNESKGNLFGSDGKTIVWISTTEEYDPKCAVPIMKYNSGSVMVRGYFSRGGIGNLCFIESIMNRSYYREIF